MRGAHRRARRSSRDPGDRILAVDGRRSPGSPISTGQTGTPLVYLREHAGQQVVLTVERTGGAVEEIPVTLRDAEAAKTQGALGVKSPTLAVGETVQRRSGSLSSSGCSARSRPAA